MDCTHTYTDSHNASEGKVDDGIQWLMVGIYLSNGVKDPFAFTGIHKTMKLIFGWMKMSKRVDSMNVVTPSTMELKKSSGIVYFKKDQRRTTDI